MITGVQFRGNLAPNQTKRWFTFNWPADWHVLWTVVPTSVRNGAPEVDWSVAVERAAVNAVTYWITISNLTNTSVDIEGRYEILNL